MPVIEDLPPAALPPLASLLPCSHFILQAHPTALIAAQQYHLSGGAGKGGGGVGGGGGGQVHVPRPADFVSLPVGGAGGRGGGGGGRGGGDTDTRPHQSVEEMRQHFAGLRGQPPSTLAAQHGTPAQQGQGAERPPFRGSGRC